MRLQTINRIFATCGISIHAPTWGATSLTVSALISLRIFQSTHPRGVRPTETRSAVSPTTHFNPRTHVGCDVGLLVVIVTVAISIHAPTWGATNASRVRLLDEGNFNPRTHVGCDLRLLLLSVLLSVFQSTHPRGVRQEQ